MIYLAGALTVIALMVLVGFALRSFLPLSDHDRESIGTLSWLGCLVYVASSFLVVQPGQGKLAFVPADREILGAYGARDADVVCARILVPTHARAVIFTVSLTILLVIWCSATDYGISVLPSLWLVCATAVLVGAHGQLALLALYGSFREASQDRARIMLCAVGLGLVAGLVIVPTAVSVLRVGSLSELTLEHVLVGAGPRQPVFWTDFSTAVPAAVVVPLLLVWLGTVVGTHGLVWRVFRARQAVWGPQAAGSRAGNGSLVGRVAPRLADSHTTIAVLVKDVVLALRGQEIRVAGYWRIHAASLFLGAALLGMHLRDVTQVVEKTPTEFLVLSVIGAVFLACAPLDQVTSLESERGGLDLLRQSPRSYSAILWSKFISTIVLLSLSTGVVVLCFLALGVEQLEPRAWVLCSWLVSCPAIAAGLVVGGAASRTADAGALEAVERSPISEVLQYLTAIAVCAPLLTLSLRPERFSTFDELTGPLLGAVSSFGVLVLVMVSTRVLMRR